MDLPGKMEAMSLIINCDMGEGMGNDAELMPYIHAANIACGAHAGNDITMHETIRLAMQYGVDAGAHISFEDREQFGRREFQLSEAALYQLVQDQLRLFLRACEKLGIRCTHVKPHGALYNLSARHLPTAQVIADAVKDISPQLRLFGLSGSSSLLAARRAGLPALAEVFADRSYQDDGSLTPRQQPGALLESVEQVLNQVREIRESGTVTSLSGKKISLAADTICIHGDGPHALPFASAIFTYLSSS